MHGYWNKVLSIDLTNQKSTAIDLDDDIYRKFTGNFLVTLFFIFHPVN